MLIGNSAAPKPSMISESTMTETRSATYVEPRPPISPAPSLPAPSGPAQIGVTLTTRNTREKLIGDAYSDYGYDYRGATLSAYSPVSPPAPAPAPPPLRHESVQSSSYYGEPIFATTSSARGGGGGMMSGYSESDVFVRSGGGGGTLSGPASPSMAVDPGVYQGEIHLGTLQRNGDGGRRYRETHERREYEEGYIDPDQATYIYTS